RRHTRFSRDWSSDVCSSDLSSTVRLIEHAVVFPSPAVAEKPGIVRRRSGKEFVTAMSMSAEEGQAGPEWATLVMRRAAATGRAKIGRASCRERVWSGGVGGW